MAPALGLGNELPGYSPSSFCHNMNLNISPSPGGFQNVRTPLESGTTPVRLASRVARKGSSNVSRRLIASVLVEVSPKCRFWGTLRMSSGYKPWGTLIL